MRTVRHNTGKQFLRLANVDAALLVASNRWRYCKAWEASLAAQKPRRRWGRVALMLLIIMVAVTACRGLSRAEARECLEQKQAQKLYRVSALSYRSVEGQKCWFPRSQGRVAKSEFRGSRPMERLSGRDVNGHRAGATGLAAGSGSAGTPRRGVEGSNPSRSTTLPGAKGDQGLARLRTHANQRGADKIEGASPSAGKPVTFEQRWGIR